MGSPHDARQATAGADGAARQLAELLRATAAMVSASTDVEVVLRWAVEVVCGHLGWPVGHILAVGTATGTRPWPDVWFVADPARYEPFVRRTREVSLATGGTLPARIVASRGPVWIADVRTDPGFARRATAAEVGLGAASAPPSCRSGESRR